jgi:DNA modification methylase
VVQPRFDSQPLSHDYITHLEPSSHSFPANTDLTLKLDRHNPFSSAHELAQDEQTSLASHHVTTHWTGQTGEGKQWDVYLGDANTILGTFPDNTYQCVVTSPPYYWLRDYGVDGQIGKEWKIKDYVQAIADVMDQVKRVLVSDGVVFLNIGDTYYSGKGESQGVDKKSRKRRFGLRAVDASGLGLPMKSLIGIPWRVAIEMIDRGWVLRSSIIWDRLHSLPESVKDRPGRTYEYIFMFVKSRKYYFNQKALNGQKDDVWTIKARPKPTPGISTAPFPDELVQKCLDVGCPLDGNVLDPFAGSGTTLRVAIQSQRDATGIDLNSDFCSYMVKELTWL